MTTSDVPGPTAATTVVRAGRENNGHALAPTLVPSTTFVTPTVEEGRRLASTPGSLGFYSRYANPTVVDFEQAVAALEGAEAARAFASGSGASSAAVLGLCSTGDHIVTQHQLYAGTRLFFEMVCPRFGIDVTYVDATEPGAFAAAVRPGKTTLVFAECPANPRLDLVDLEEIGGIAGPVTLVDATFATPLGLRPLEWGVDLSLHSATKALAGHNDASLGIISGSQELIDWIWGFAVLHGANASPFDAMNGLRGLRTLDVRFRRQSTSAGALAEHLHGHDAVTDVRYPGHPSHPQAALASRMLDLPGGVLTFDLRGGLDAGRRLLEGVRIAQPASSLGGPETLVTHPASTTHVNLNPEELAAGGIGPGTIRMSVGLEGVEDLIRDLDQALSAS